MSAFPVLHTMLRALHVLSNVISTTNLWNGHFPEQRKWGFIICLWPQQLRSGGKILGRILQNLGSLTPASCLSHLVFGVWRKYCLWAWKFLEIENTLDKKGFPYHF